MARRKRVKLDFFQELEALQCGFFQDLEEMLEAEAQKKRDEAADRERRAQNAIKARRIYPRLKAVENFDCWAATSHIVPDFFGSNRDRVKAVKRLHDKQQRIRWFLRTLYNLWMFDISAPHQTKWMGLRYSRHRKWFLKKIKEHKRNARKIRRVTKKQAREIRRQQATEALDQLKNSKAITRLRESKDDEPESKVHWGL